MAQWLSWLERRPVTAKVVGSSPIWVVNGVLAQLGEHLPYKQRVIGSSPIGPIIIYSVGWCGGIGRRKGLKIPRGQPRAGSSPATSSILRVGETLKTQRFSYFHYIQILFVNVCKKIPLV